jgi:minor extracellular serine protease Vpr
MKKITIFMPLLLTFLVGCQPNKSVHSFLGGEDPNKFTAIFSTRPQNQTHFIAIIKLQSPALLTQAKLVNGVNVIDPKANELLNQEQTEFIEALKILSSEIRVLYTYKYVVNGLAILAPIALQEKIKKDSRVVYIEQTKSFAHPQYFRSYLSLTLDLKERNSVKFIGGEQVRSTLKSPVTGNPITGAGIRVGIIDTGIDYTHSMFGGLGTEAAFKAVEPAKPAEGYPNNKVVGGIDLVGTKYDSGSAIFDHHIPEPDLNPVDESGHGTHVAGTVAGKGDWIETYDGVAPDASLYAIKVFGQDGSTSDAVVVAALEYSADPNKDGDLSDQLHVVNLSLGSPWGNPSILYSEAIMNLSKAGTSVVCSAGNSGAVDYITGAPGSSDHAISVAASVDDGFHNWQFRAVKFITGNGQSVLTEAVESAMAKPLSELTQLKSQLFYIGLANQELTPEQKATLKDKIALIDRGAVTFAEKIKRAAEAGAVAVIVVNNNPDAPFVMGGNDKFSIPAIMIGQQLGQTLKDTMRTEAIEADFVVPDRIQKPELIDTITGFSSKGPRSFDSAFKPEISAPGSAVISAAMGSGAKGVKFSGTSMAAPHLAGVVALVKNFKPELNSEEVKSVLMNTSKIIQNTKSENYPLTLQGAGRVEAYLAALAETATVPAAISLGEISLEKAKIVKSELVIKNLTDKPVEYSVEFSSSNSLKLVQPTGLSLLTVKPKDSLKVDLKFLLQAQAQFGVGVSELTGNLILKTVNAQTRVPVLAVEKRISAVQATELAVSASSAVDSLGALTELHLKNSSQFSAKVLPFNLLAKDSKKQDSVSDPAVSKACDLQAAGYKLVDKIGGSAELQIAIKLYQPLTTWNECDVSLLIDSNNDEVIDQELVTMPAENLKGLVVPAGYKIVSVLLDAIKASEIRKKYEQELAESIASGKPAPKEDYQSAILDIQPQEIFNNSSVHVLKTQLGLLKTNSNNELRFKLVTQNTGSAVIESDDYLGTDKAWQKLVVHKGAQSFVGLPETVEVLPNADAKIEFTKGEGDKNLLLLSPTNRNSFFNDGTDQQIQVVVPKYKL